MPSKKLLMISTDRLIFNEKSDVRARQIEYAKEWDEVHIVVFYFKGISVGSKDGGEMSVCAGEKISDNCWIYSTDSAIAPCYPFDATRIGRKIIRERGITEITCQDPSLTAMAGVSLKKTFNLPLEIQVHGDIGSPYFTYNFTNKVRKMLALRYLPLADRIRVVSQRIKDYLVCGNLEISPEKVEVRPIFVNIESLRSAPVTVDLHKKYSQFEKIVLMASRLEKEKNIGLALMAWSELLKKQPEAGLVIVGEGSCKMSLMKLALKLRISNNVIFEPWADRSVLASYYKTADIFLNTSLFEGYGMTLVEAKAAGCKVVSTDVGVAGETGAVIVENNPASVSDALDKSLS